MKTTAHRDELLSTIVLDPTLHPVIDDLAGLERLVPVAPGETESLHLPQPAARPARAPGPGPGAYRTGPAPHPASCP